MLKSHKPEFQAVRVGRIPQGEVTLSSEADSLFDMESIWKQMGSTAVEAELNNSATETQEEAS